MREQIVSKQTLQRLPLYVNYLKALPRDLSHISATSIADGLGLNDVQVRKDLAAVTSGGRPKIGYLTSRLVEDIQQFLEYGGGEQVVIVGMGHLGRALAHYSGFSEYGQNIAAVFDNDDAVIGRRYQGQTIRSAHELEQVCRERNVSIGIITVPETAAQDVCDRLVRGGVKAIWNFAPTHLTVPEGILVQNENMAVSLAILAKQVSEPERWGKGVACNE